MSVIEVRSGARYRIGSAGNLDPDKVGGVSGVVRRCPVGDLVARSPDLSAPCPLSSVRPIVKPTEHRENVKVFKVPEV